MSEGPGALSFLMFPPIASVFSFATWDGGGGQVPCNPCLRSAFMFPDSQTHTNTHPDRVEFRAFCQGPGVLEKCKAPCGRCQAGAPCRQSLSAKVPQKRMSRWESKGDRSGLGRILLPSPVYSSLKEVEEMLIKMGKPQLPKAATISNN